MLTPRFGKRRPNQFLRVFRTSLKEVPKSKRVYVDESGVTQYLTREFGRTLRGEKVEDVKRGRKRRRINVVTRQFEDETGKIRRVATYRYVQDARSNLFETSFKTRLMKSVARGSTIVMDRASFHRKESLENLARRHGVKILFLPAYSPDFNIIERTWAYVKKTLIDVMPTKKYIKTP